MIYIFELIFFYREKDGTPPPPARGKNDWVEKKKQKQKQTTQTAGSASQSINVARVSKQSLL